MQVKTLLLAVILLTMPTIQPVQADDAYMEFNDAQILIDACWAISEEDRASGNTPRMRYGNAKTLGCLKKVVLDQVDILFPDGKYLSREKANEYLDYIEIGVQKLYWAIYNDNVGCAPLCGTIYHILHLGPNSKILEDMIRVMIKQRKHYGL